MAENTAANHGGHVNESRVHEVSVVSRKIKAGEDKK